jgi:hypothetical protein
VRLLAADAARNELVVIRDRTVLDVAEIPERSAVVVAIVHRPLGLAVSGGGDVVAFIDDVPGFDALGVRLAASLVERRAAVVVLVRPPIKSSIYGESSTGLRPRKLIGVTGGVTIRPVRCRDLVDLTDAQWETDEWFKQTSDDFLENEKTNWNESGGAYNDAAGEVRNARASLGCPQRGQAAGKQARQKGLPQDGQGSWPAGSVRCSLSSQTRRTRSRPRPASHSGGSAALTSGCQSRCTTRSPLRRRINTSKRCTGT